MAERETDKDVTGKQTLWLQKHCVHKSLLLSSMIITKWHHNEIWLKTSQLYSKHSCFISLNMLNIASLKPEILRAHYMQ